jgi:putative membrane protein insertion efficiency factor
MEHLIMESMSLRRIVNLVPMALIRFYRAYLSPLLGPSCRYYPTCSQYALEAYDAHNFFYASWLTIWRILRCNPFSKGGYDPVPLQSGRKPDNLKEGDNG